MNDPLSLLQQHVECTRRQAAAELDNAVTQFRKQYDRWPKYGWIESRDGELLAIAGDECPPGQVATWYGMLNHNVAEA